MKNKHQWEGNATPYEHHGLNDFSSSGRSEGNAHNSRGHAHPVKSWKATPVLHKSPTPASEAWDPIPGSTQTHPMLGIKNEEMSGHVGDGRKVMAPMTGAKTFSPDPKESMGKKWTKRGYHMETPSSESTGTMRKKH